MKVQICSFCGMEKRHPYLWSIIRYSDNFQNGVYVCCSFCRKSMDKGLSILKNRHGIIARVQTLEEMRYV